MTFVQPNFDKYDDPKRARAIWKAYSPYLIGSEHNSLVFLYSTCWDLDLELDRITSSSSRFGGRVVGKTRSDPDSDGSWGNAVRTYEEQEH